MMNCLRNTRSLLSQIMLRCKAPAARSYHGHAAPRRLMQDLGSIRGSADIKPACRPMSTSPRTFVLRWYHDPRKVATATAMTLSATAITLSATVMAGCNREIVPCTNRSHLVMYSHQEERDLGESAFTEEKAKCEIVDNPSDPRIVRFRLIAERIIHAAYRGLGIDDSNDAPMLRVTEKKRPKWGKTWAPRPHTSHLRGLNWEVILARDDEPYVQITTAGKILVNSGLFRWFRTDDEIAAIVAHEVGHIIARHQADITKMEWLPTCVRLFFARRFEMEADYIGALLLGAAGFDPRWALVMIEKLAKIDGDSVLGNIGKGHPDNKKRLRVLSEPKIMEEAMELYGEVTAMDKVIDRYFR